MAGDWSDAQNDAIVADYCAMLADDLAGHPYGKAGHNRLLQAMSGDLPFAVNAALLLAP